jgi:hypothetical protein
MRRRAKVDANQGTIVRVLRQVGADVQSIATVGDGVPDLLVAYRGVWYVGEVKDGEKVASAQQLTPDEMEWHSRFGRNATIHVWRSADDALRTIGAI